MNRIAHGIVHHRKLILILFILIVAVSGFMALFVKVNYNLAAYVPDVAPSTKAMRVMEEEFSQAIPNVRVYIPNITLSEALEYKDRILAVEDVTGIIWLDDFVDLKLPLSILPEKLVKEYYKDGGAMYQVIVDIDDTSATKNALQEIAGEEGAVEGQLIDLAIAKEATSSEMSMIMMIMVPLGVLILTLSTRSWIEPLLLLMAIGVAVVINMGTNYFLGEVSFITQAVSGVLQLAVSMDYAIFLLHARQRYRDQGLSTDESMVKAIVTSSNAILASSMTTVLGFLSLIFMRFKIGPDLGIVLAKGVLFSLVSVIVFLPVIILLLDKVIDKTVHRPLLPSFEKLSRGVSKICVFILLLGILIVPAFLAQKRIHFTYGSGVYAEGSREQRDQKVIYDNFGKSFPTAILVPKGMWGIEQQFIDELAAIPEVLGTMSYISQVSRLIPSEVLPQEQIKDLLSENYSRIIITVESLKEGEDAFRLVEDIRDLAYKYYGDEYYLVGESAVTLDMKNTINKDNLIVNGLAILSVGLVLMISFRSLSIPLILLLTIETSIWVNLAFPYFKGETMNYIGYLVISTVQLGATVDYAILYTQHYLKNRQTVDKREAVFLTGRDTIGTLITPALILTLAGVILNRLSSIEVVSQLGDVLGRGALTSFLMVIFFLPGLLFILDFFIRKTTWKSQMKGGKK